MRSLRIALGTLAIVLVSTAARASGSAQSYPDEGSEPMGRGGAWVARASDPIALSRNPAGLAGQPLRLSAGEDLPFRHACFTRVKAASDTTDDGVAPGSRYPRVCDDAAPLPVGFLALNLPLGERAAIAAGIVTPHGVPRASWPSFVGASPSPQRYLLLESTAVMAIPTIGAAYEIARGLRLGASVGWGLAWVETSAAAPGLAQDGISPALDDVKVTVKAKDLFVPRATLGAHASVGPLVELGAMFAWSAPIVAGGVATTEANAFTARAAGGDTSKIARGRIEGAELSIPLPMEAALGVRVRLPRDGEHARREPMEGEIADLELDVTWSNDGAIDRYGVRFPPGVLVPGTAGTLPADASAERRHRDVVGVRVGGDANLIPGVLAVRAGTFVEPRTGTAGFTGLETMSGTRAGVSLGVTARVHARGGAAFDVSLALLHVFVSDLDASDPSADGLRAVTGTEPHRTRWPVGLGTIEDGLDVLHLGVAYRF